MTIYKHSSLIPAGKDTVADAANAAGEDTVADAVDAAGKDTVADAADAAAAVPTPAAGSTDAPGSPASPAVPPSDGAALEPPAQLLLPPVYLHNGAWAATDLGLESRVRVGDPPTLVEYVIDAPRLRLVRAGAPGVSDCALHLAGKSWVTDPEPMLEALGAALQAHHPGQQVVDMEATVRAARLEWERTHRPRDDEEDALGYDYFEHAPQRFAAYEARAQRVPQQAAEKSLAWVDAFPAEHRDALLREGIYPDDHPNAGEYNLKLLHLVATGVSGAALAEGAAFLRRGYLFEEEPEHEEPPPELEIYVEGLIDDRPITAPPDLASEPGAVADDEVAREQGASPDSGEWSRA